MKHHPEIQRAAQRLTDARAALAAERELADRNASDAWRQDGGCLRCDGLGSVLTWSTLDGWGYNEWGWCNGLRAGFVLMTQWELEPVDRTKSVTPEWADERNAKTAAQVARWGELLPGAVAFDDKGRLVVTVDIPCTAKTVGPRPGVVLHHSTSDCNRPRSPLPIPPLVSPELPQLEAAEREAEREAERAVRLWAPVVGAVVVVARGRKVPQGTRGVVVWHGEGDYGVRVGVRDDAGATHYTAGANVDVLTPSPAALMPELYGSPKQVAWAERIRLEALSSGAISPQEAEAHGGARWWIETHGKRSAA